MPFGPKNAPSFYFAMMKNTKDEQDSLFMERLQDLFSTEGEIVFISATMDIYIGNRKKYIWYKNNHR